ncbi:hypothetical protein ANN_21761 [Periplaneta americana]|uniref:Uncharacterized protein n=1 Tax=Periplaneta americana TaxID=6978 RepID=A0ABQ8S6U4_PERAM|nr:hypothetical protein ANN_21761 [Periplaneta americana]
MAGLCEGGNEPSGSLKAIYRPVAPKKQKHQAAQKLKKMISKTVNETMEDELRARALDGKKSLVSKKRTTSGKSRGAKKT